MKTFTSPAVVPAGPILAGIAAVVVAMAAGITAAQPDNLPQLRAQALELVNRSREQNGLPPLEQNDPLNEAAQAHAADMLERDYYAHVGPDGTTPRDRYVDAGGSRWRLVQENIARCAECRPPAEADDIERLHKGWMQSPGHRKNILAEGLTGFGFGIVVDPEQGLYAAQTFAGPGAPPARADQDAEPLSPEERVSQALTLINETRRKEGVPPLQIDQDLVKTARTLLSDDKLKDFSPEGIETVTEAMPPGERDEWLALSTLTADCGGCGPEPTDANLRRFHQRWLNRSDYRSILLDPSLKQLGFAMRANGKGRQLAVAVLGARY